MRPQKDIEAVKFYRNAKLYAAVVVNLRENGVLLKAQKGNLPKNEEGKSGEYYLKTKYGKTKFRGVINNVSQTGNELYWDIEFIELSPSKEDPLRKIIDAIVFPDSY